MADRDAVHRRCLEAKSRKAGAEWELCFSLLEALRAEVWLSFGMASVIEYADRFLGLTAKATCERLRVARELEELPKISEALRDGSLAWTVVREVTRVARAGHDQAWLDKVKDLSAREVEDLVAMKEPGDAPDDPPRDTPRRHKVVIEMDADDYALWREAVGALQKSHVGPLGESKALALMARAVLGGPSDEGRSSYQVQVTVCEGCGKGWQDGRGQTVTQWRPRSSSEPCATRRFSASRRRRRSRRRPGARSCGGIMDAAGCRGADWRRGSTCTTSSFARRGATTARTTASCSARATTRRSTTAG
jgi:hypothetical protein